MARIEITLIQPDRSQNTLEVTLKNNVGSDIRLLKWGTPFDHIENDCFNITLNDSDKSDYSGRHASRMFNYKHSSIYIPRDAEITANVDLEKYWMLEAFAIYGVELKSKNVEICKVASKDESVTYESFTSLTVATKPIKVVLKPTLKRIDLPEITETKTPQFTLDDLESELRTAMPVCTNNVFCLPPAYNNGGECLGHRFMGYPRMAANNQNDKGVIDDYIQLHHKCWRESMKWQYNKWDFHKDPIYSRWFGAYNKTRAIHVADVLKSALSIKSCLGFYIVFDLDYGAEDDVLAYWKKNESPNLSVLGITRLYFKAPASGFYSKFGILAHELTHAYGGTRDIGYGRDKCIRLAKNDPDSAMHNADNYHHYLVEKLGL
ncbi:hypothetical protein C1M56_03065 [Vibrio diazotrophicus]|nr:hypothetical protein C1M56_03065 [Vibrio diazotrophicus]